jgi:hypothetical protein
MTEVERVFDEYVREHRSGGEADPSSFLTRVASAERRELAALIDSYLARSPRQDFDAGRFRGSSAERTVDEFERVLGGQAGLWPALLPRLRDRVGLKRSRLVEQLASALGVASKTAKIGDYYHQMEQGTLPAAGVSTRVLEALGQLVGETAQALREAGERRGEASAPAAPQTAFARRTYAESAGAPSPGRPAPAEEPAEWDEVDQLFRGG